MNSGSWYWPDVSDLDGAKDAARYGMWCAFLVAGVTALFVVLSLFGTRLMGITPAALLDAATLSLPPVAFLAWVFWAWSSFSAFSTVSAAPLLIKNWPRQSLPRLCRPLRCRVPSDVRAAP